MRPGDILLAIDNQPVDARLDVINLQHQGRPGDRHTYTLLRLGSQEMTHLSLMPMPSGAGLFYYVLAAVGIFTLLVGAAVRARPALPPAPDPVDGAAGAPPATLHLRVAQLDAAGAPGLNTELTIAL